MRDFVKDAWKTATGCAIGAFLLSLVVGLIAGNPFGNSFSRALLLAMLFAALGAGLRAVLKAYLPELASGGASAAAPSAGAPSASAGSAAAAGSPVRPGAVDIVVDDDESLRRQAYQGDEDSAARAFEDSEASEVLEEGALEGEAQSAEELPDELEEDREAGARPSSGGGQARDAEAAEEVQPSDDLEAGPAAEDLDALPDIADLEAPAAAGRGSMSRPLGRIPAGGGGDTGRCHAQPSGRAGSRHAGEGSSHLSEER